MGLFIPTPKVFKNKEEIRTALLEIESLDYKERPEVLEALIAELDDGGVTAQELKAVVLRLRKEFKISETDAKNILSSFTE